ncbi:McrC family protein [Mucilaginibacter paludis]|uniref:5-methylcytosine restriction system component-like protein n=1 Tax=Mucilaginibacter paludis DSM 18603 TaxID=714943 RepID=H1Y1T3_9SPHI|nr:5-methylcytosine restriction system component-like protein [Mucilaginibacter paludis]EHQ24742.1 5-methylcytosine restriction system component-like protein [Mucilaginibacter paludis DSM 18603]
MFKTFEFGDWFPISNRKTLQPYLEEVWTQSKPLDDELQPITEDVSTLKSYQGFLTFDGTSGRARNYIGFIQSDDFHLEVYPKVFKRQSIDEDSIKLFLKHIFYWFDYCRRWKFPFTNVNLDSHDCENFPELMINLMADQIISVITNSPLMLYEEIEESLSIPRGRINFTRYLNSGLSNGNQHILECDHEPLMFDNQLNRIIKHVTRQLKQRAKFPETLHKLNEILFILDEVTDESCNSSSLSRVKLNPFFDDYNDIVSICRLVLNQEIYSNNHYEQSHWCLLFPMEYIFEDFVAGFIEKELSAEWIIEFQKQDLYLTDKPSEAFKMKHDILLTSKFDATIKIIVDTKYKIRSKEDQRNSKKGIAQSDMYQMTAYALRRACTHVLLLYPNEIEVLKNKSEFIITSGFEKSHAVKIIAGEIPFWSMDNFGQLSVELKRCLSGLLTIN